MTRDEEYSKGHCTSYIQLVRGSDINDVLHNEKIVWIFFLRVGDYTGLLGVTVETISRAEIGTRQWIGKQEAVAAMAGRGT